MDEHETPEQAAARHSRAPHETVPHLVLLATDPTRAADLGGHEVHAVRLVTRRDHVGIAASVLADTSGLALLRTVELADEPVEGVELARVSAG